MAARPGEQHTVLFSLRHTFFVIKEFARKPIARAIASTLKSCCVFADYQTKRKGIHLSFLFGGDNRT